jgi:hypothetical protein
MTVTKQHPNGGVFTSQFNVLPRFTFTEVGNPTNQKVLDFGIDGRPPVILQPAGPTPWAHSCDLVFVVTPNLCPGVDTSNNRSLAQYFAPNAQQGLLTACYDPDLDGVGSCVDNCPAAANAGQQNAVHPATFAGDACEDPDADGIVDASDACPNDGNNDSDGDGICNGPSFQAPKTGATDNCPTVSNATQENADGDEYGDACEQPQCVTVVNHWAVPPGDGDCDGFTGTNETFLGTLPANKCAATSTPDDESPPNAWPADFNDDQVADLQDVLKFNLVFGSLAINGPPYSARFDFNEDSAIDLQDVLQFNAYFGRSCAP